MRELPTWVILSAADPLTGYANADCIEQLGKDKLGDYLGALTPTTMRHVNHGELDDDEVDIAENAAPWTAAVTNNPTPGQQLAQRLRGRANTASSTDQLRGE